MAQRLIVIGAISLNPFSSVISSVSKGIGYVAGESRYATMVEQGMIVDEVVRLGTNVRLRQEKLNQAIDIPIAFPKKQPSSQIPGYYTSIDRPITEIGALGSMVDKTIPKPTDGFARRARVVAQDPFRANLQQQELHKYGFETRVIPPGVDAQKEAKGWGADVILGIRQIDGPSKKYYDDIKRKIPPPFPPDKFGGAGVPKQNWDWGKPFTPTYPKGAPGGISTEELARSFVDKGNWPVLTSFGLFYKVAPSAEENNPGGGE